MVNCPKCQRPVSGRARSCGYCGESLLGEYFQQQGKPQRKREAQPSSPARISGMVIGVCGCLVLLVALYFQISSLFTSDLDTAPAVSWWLRTLPLAVVPPVLLVHLLIRRGACPLWAGGLLLFAAAVGLTATVLAFLNSGVGAFYSITPLPYLLVVGCALLTIAACVLILTWRSA